MIFKKTDKIKFIYNNQVIKKEKKKGKRNRTCSVIMDIPPHYKFMSKAIFLFDGKTHYVHIAPKASIKEQRKQRQQANQSHQETQIIKGNQALQKAQHKTKPNNSNLNSQKSQNIQENKHLVKSSKPIVHIHKPIKRMTMPSPNQKNSFIPVKETVPQVPKSVQAMFKQNTNINTKEQANASNHKTSTSPKVNLLKHKVNSQHPQTSTTPVAKSLSEIKLGQTMKYQGTLVTNQKTTKINDYVAPTRTISLYSNLVNAVKHNPIGAKPTASFTAKIIKYYIVKGFQPVFQIELNKHTYFVTASYVQKAYIQPSELQQHLQGIIPHASALIYQNIQEFNQQGNAIGKIKQGQKVNVVNVQSIPQQKTVLKLDNDNLILANKNYVKLI